MKCRNCAHRHTDKVYEKTVDYENFCGETITEEIKIIRCRKCGWIGIVENGQLVKQVNPKTESAESGSETH